MMQVVILEARPFQNGKWERNMKKAECNSSIGIVLLTSTESLIPSTSLQNRDVLSIQL